MEAKEVETRVDTQHNWETDYGSYDRDYRKRTAIEVTVRDFSRKSPPATAHIYFIARALKGGPRFIYAQRDLPINFSGQLAVVARVDAPDLKSSVVNFAALGQQYVAGAEMDGWAVVGEVGGKTFQTKASRQPLLDTLLRPGPESMETMLAAYLNATKP